jgi:hypothetical protein
MEDIIFVACVAMLLSKDDIKSSRLVDKNFPQGDSNLTYNPR